MGISFPTVGNKIRPDAHAPHHNLALATYADTVAGHCRRGNPRAAGDVGTTQARRQNARQEVDTMMEHGVRIPARKRDTMAREALRIFEAAKTRIEGLCRVEIQFDVSTPTARNLVSRGRFLRDSK